MVKVEHSELDDVSKVYQSNLNQSLFYLYIFHKESISGFELKNVVSMEANFRILEKKSEKLKSSALR